jgi:hypothetical protein
MGFHCLDFGDERDLGLSGLEDLVIADCDETELECDLRVALRGSLCVSIVRLLGLHARGKLVRSEMRHR